MSNYIRCDQCGCDSLDTDTLRCSCGSDAPTSCAAAERFSAELRALRRVAEAAKKYRSAETADMGFELWKHEAHGRRVDATGDALDAALKEAGL